MKLLSVCLLCCCICLSCTTAKTVGITPRKRIPNQIQHFIHGYPDYTFTVTFDEKYQDWQIQVQEPAPKSNKRGKKTVFYWADGKVLPKKELKHSEHYTPIFYDYPDRRCNPDTMLPEDFEEMEQSGTKEARMINPGTAVFFYDFIYSSHTQKNVETQLLATSFLQLPTTRVHKKIIDELAAIEIELRRLEKQDDEVKIFLASLRDAQGYFWRNIRGTKRKSFHSLGIALDILPTNYAKKTIYWAWTRDKVGKDWIKTPWKERWMPPESVIAIFEAHGFIWGGKWDVWDNMHFEYRPEMLLNSKEQQTKAASYF